MPIPIIRTNPTKFKVAFGTGHVITTSIFLYTTVTPGTAFGVGPSFDKYKNRAVLITGCWDLYGDVIYDMIK